MNELTSGNRLKIAAAMLILPTLPGAAVVATHPAPVPAPYDEIAVGSPEWSPERAALGKKLFQDRRLSRDGTVSCQDCHRPELAFTDGRKTAEGVKGKVGPRNTPTLVNRALGQAHFWDGRASSLEDQAMGPITNPGEMDLTPEEAVARIQADPEYRKAFREAFGGEPSAAGVASAIAAYERTIYSVDAPFDRFMAGDETVLNPAARRGLALFGGKARCAECHSGSNFSDELYHCLGLPGDDGRGKVTKNEQERGAFRTPTLREIAHTAPYMHDGSVATLAGVIDYYDRGGDPHPNLDSKMQKLRLTAGEKADLLAFLRALSGRVVELQMANGGRELQVAQAGTRR